MYSQNIVAAAVLVAGFLMVQAYDFAGYARRARLRGKIEELTDGPAWLAVLMAPIYLLACLTCLLAVVGACVGPVLLVVVVFLGLAE